MCQDDELETDATEDQLVELRKLGVREGELDELTYEEAEEWIASLRAKRQDAGKFRPD